MVLQPPSPREGVSELPLFYADSPSPIVEHSLLFSPPPSPPSALETEDQELQAQMEMRERFGWFIAMLNENQKRGWGTGYRDFADVLLLLRAVSSLGMKEQGNNRLSNGVFSASVGDFGLDLWTFIHMMDLGHSPGTWRNKLTTYFRIKSLHLYSQHIGGIGFQDQSHVYAWNVVSPWMEHRDKLLGEDVWVTKRFGSTELRPLIRNMVQAAYAGEHPPGFGLH